MPWRSEIFMYELKDTKQELNYNSKDGMQSAIFGPAFWMSIHLVSFNYPLEPTEVDKKNYHNWLMSIGKVLPCRYCRENFENNLKTAGYSDLALQSRDAFSRFCYDLHCVVNSMLNKKSPPYETVRDQYEMFRAKCLSEDQKKELRIDKKELGCIRPIHNGERGKCVIKVIPNISDTNLTNHITVDDRCKPNNY